MARFSSLLTALFAAASGASASLVQARRALAERQSSGSQVNAVQNWANDYATLDFKTGSNGLFSVDWNNAPGGNFVVGRGWRPAREMSVQFAHYLKDLYGLIYVPAGWSTTPVLFAHLELPILLSTVGPTILW